MKSTKSSQPETKFIILELQMDDELATLQMYFQKCEVQCQEDDRNNDENLIEGEFWQFKEPERVEAWSLFMIPFRNEMTLSFKSLQEKGVF